MGQAKPFQVSGTIPKDWLLMCLSETMSSALPGDWYCCLRQLSGRAASGYGITAQEAFDTAVGKASNYVN